MKNHVRKIVALLAVSAAWPLFAQTAAPVDAATLAKYDKNKNGMLDPDELAAMQSDQEAVQLSAFEVRTDQDRGYQALNAGSGGRVDLPLKLTPAAMSAMTKEFLDDWSITDMHDSFKYAMNVDAANNSSQNGGPFGDFQFNFRGVGDSGNYPTRNYFLYYGNSDTYNTERIEFARGPNSVLFGDGQIGGVATTMTKQPKLGRDAYSASVRYDSWGGLRGTIDANKVLSDKQAVRVNAVYNRNDFGPQWRDGSWQNERGIDVAWAYKFTPNTTLRTEAEWMNTKRGIFSTTYSDQVGYYTPNTVYDGVTAFTSAQQSALGVTPVSTNAQNWTVIPGENGLFVNTGASAAYRSTGTGIAIQPNGRDDLPGIATRAKLPSREFTINDTDSYARYKYQVYSFYLDHRFSDSVNGQLSFYDYNNDRNTHQGSNVGSLQYDINKFLPGTTTPNPKLGVLYGEVTPNKSVQENYVHEWRGLITWKTRLPWDGRAQFSGIVGDRAERFEARGLSPARVDGPNQNWTAAENTLRYRFYADQPLSYASGGLPKDVTGFTYRWVQTGFASVEKKDILYAQTVAAASFLDERVSLLGGVRNDDLTDAQYGNIGGFNDIHGLQGYGGFVPGTGTRPGGVNLTLAGALTYNYGGTVWFDKNKTIGAFYNWSKNFAPPTSGAAKLIGFNPDGTINGGAFGATTGHSKEYGLRFSFLDGAITAEARKYDSLQVDRIDQGAPTGNITSIWSSAGLSYNTNTNLTQMSFRDVGALSAEGYEYQATANFKGLRLSANYSLPKTASVDVRPATLAYANYFIPIWQKWANDGHNDKPSDPALTAAEVSNINAQILNIQNNIAGSAPGTVNNGTNKYTASLNATYAFGRETMLKGFQIGFGYSARGKRKNGSVPPAILYNLPSVTGNTVNPTPQQNHDAAFAYLYTPAYSTIDMNMGYSRKIGKYNWRFQVNVNNLTDKDDLLFTGFNTYRVLGQGTNPLLGMFPGGYTWLDPRKISFTTSVSF